MKQPNPNDGLGLFLAVTSSLGLGLAMVMSRYAYDGGANGLALGTARAIFFVPVLYAFCRLTGRSLKLSRSDWRQCALLGIFMATGFYGHVGAIEFIPVGLAAVLFFTFPPMIGILQAVVAKEPPGLGKTIALVVAFMGLTLMLGFSFESAEPRGIVLALGAALCIAWNTFWTARRVPHIDGVVSVFHMGVVAMLILLTVSLFTGKALLPATGVGWTGLIVVALLQTISLPLFYLALPRIGSLKAGMMGNVQPLISIVLAFLLFGELMSVAQFAGGAMVLFGVWLMQQIDTRRMRGE